MGRSKTKRARLENLRKAYESTRQKKLTVELKHQPGYQIRESQVIVDVQDAIKDEVKDEPGDDDPEDDFYRDTGEQGTPTVVPTSSSTIKPSLSPSNRQCEYRCLLCYKTIDITGQLTDCEETSFRTMFLLRKMLDVPKTMLEDYLEKFGSPGTWVSVCVKCGVLVDKALGIQKKIGQLEKSLKSCQQEMISAVKNSHKGASCFGQSSQSVIIRVTYETREFVCTGKADTGHKKDVTRKCQKVRRRPKPRVSCETSPSVIVGYSSSFDDDSPSPLPNLPNSQEFPITVTSERSLENLDDPLKIVESTEPVSFQNIHRKKGSGQTTEKVLKMGVNATYICILCPHLHDMPLQSFLIHVLFHHNRPFRCSGCKLYYAHPKELEVSSMPEKSTNEDIQSNHDHHVCTVETLVETKFQPKNVWTCDQCPETFDLESERDSHERQAHQNQIMSDLKYKCIVCSQKYKHFNEWRLHRVLEHPEVAKLSCYFCDEYFGVKAKEGVDVLFSRESRRAHVKKQHGKNICNYDLNACDHCGENFPTAAKLSSHQQEVHGLPPKNTYSCPICWLRFNKYASLTVHLKYIHRARIPEAFVCETCGHSTTHMLSLAQHNLIQHGVRPANKRLTVHSCKSEGCKFESILKQPFEVHKIKVHGADRKFTCQFCGKGFLDTKHCSEHEKIHINKTVKPYKCEICGNSFAVKNYLYIHMRLSHLNRPFASTHRKRTYRKKGLQKQQPRLLANNVCKIVP